MLSVFLCVRTARLIMDFIALSVTFPLGLKEPNPSHFGEMIFSTAASPNGNIPLSKSELFIKNIDTYEKLEIVIGFRE